MRRTLCNVAESDPYSIRCENCECSFAPETKRCVHCGGALGVGLMAALRAVSGESAGESADADKTPASNKLWIVMALLGIGFSMVRQCG